VSANNVLIAVIAFIGGLAVMFAIVYFLGNPLKTSWGGGPSINPSVQSEQIDDQGIPDMVDVSGNIDILDVKSRPWGATFTDQVSEFRYFATAFNGKYSVELPNGMHTYDVQVTWQKSDGTMGNCDGGTLSYTTQADGRETFNTAC